MSGFGRDQKSDLGGRATFWKKGKTVPGSIKPVYGAQHPPIQEKIGSGPPTPKKEDTAASRLKNKRDSFQDFENDTIDAWDDGDDDVMLMAHKMSLRDVHSSAMAVLNNHSQQILQNSSQTGRVGVRGGSKTAVGAAGAGEKDDAGVNENEKPSHQNGAENNQLSERGMVPVSPHSPGVSGPGVGVRLNYGLILPKSSPMQYVNLPELDKEKKKLEKFHLLVDASTTDLSQLREMSWSGIPKSVRPITWKLLSGYLPPSFERRQPTLERKRNEYFSFVEQYYDTRHQEIHEGTYRQIQKDLCRMTLLTNRPKASEIFERILYIWAIRHPASGYVQGMNDLVTPFFIVFLTEFIDNDVESDNCDLSQLPQEQLNVIEADCYWCLSKLLDGIQDNYTFAQPGIQVKVNALKELVKRIDLSLHQHLEEQSVEYLQFAFRWMNNLLMREIPLRCTIRLWDTYLSEIDGFAFFHLYVCAAFLVKFSKDLQRERDFQGLMIMLQNLPTYHWGDEEIGLLLAEAYKLKFMFADAPNHLNPGR
ncbi:TBC1 domain family member 22B-like isoform X2 [Tubulanus polymorphus]|uniref:TBC1 domain family member 22B-like isoform X2 n=1 Tax=Tubulanus polymorphus TaxID=672921 RepID=UPI003DA4B938